MNNKPTKIETMHGTVVIHFIPAADTAALFGAPSNPTPDTYMAVHSRATAAAPTQDEAITKLMQILDSEA